MAGGLFSIEDRARPVAGGSDAAALAGLTADRLGAALQHAPKNPLAGLDGRAALLRRLGEVIADAPKIFGRPARLGHLYDYWLPQRDGLAAPDMLRLILRALGPIWPGRLSVDGVPLGDCGHHDTVPGDGLVPLHKLSQWLVYSLVEPLDRGGVPRHRDRRAHRPCRISQWRAVYRRRRAGAARRTGLPARPLDPLGEEVGRVAGR